MCLIIRIKSFQEWCGGRVVSTNVQKKTMYLHTIRRPEIPDSYIGESSDEINGHSPGSISNSPHRHQHYSKEDHNLSSPISTESADDNHLPMYPSAAQRRRRSTIRNQWQSTTIHGSGVKAPRWWPSLDKESYWTVHGGGVGVSYQQPVEWWGPVRSLTPGRGMSMTSPGIGSSHRPLQRKRSTVQSKYRPLP